MIININIAVKIHCKIYLQPEDFMEKNRKAWDEVVPIHSSHRTGEAQFFKNGGITLDKIELGILPELIGKKVAHLCCNSGQDTLSLANLGAKCVGFDFSESAIEQAKHLSKESGIEAEFVKVNVLDIPKQFNGKFDLVYISKGVLVWLPDAWKLMRSASRILVASGKLFIYDQHPFVHLFDSDDHADLRVKFDYFRHNPYEYKGLDYIGGTAYDASPNYQFMVRLSDIINGICENGMKIDLFREFKHSMFRNFPDMIKCQDGLYRFQNDDNGVSIPLMMAILATRIPE